MNAKRFARATFAIALAAITAACDSAAPLVATNVESTFPANVSAAAGTSVAQAPGVRVTSAKGKPVPGVQVTFAVTGGGGMIVGGDQTTGADGKAGVVYWKLGNTTGVNTLTATAGSLPPVTITATGFGGPAVKLGVATAPSAAATNRVVLATQPVIQMQDQFGNANGTSTAQVSAALVSGSGTLNGTLTVAAVAGVATFTNLSVAGPAGLKTINFTSNDLTAVQATITTTAGVASSLAVGDGDNQSAQPGSAVATPPSVIVTDADGNPVAGTSVTYAVTSGGGSVTGANPTSNANGAAAVGSWTLGPSLGANTMTATSAGLANSPVTFTAQGTNTAIATISPATLTSGATATISGAGFSPTPASNAVTIDGVAASVTAATATQLTVTVPTLPCTPGHNAVVSVNPNNTGATVKNWPVLAPTPISLTAGQSAILSTAAAARCNELSSTGGLYYLAVYNANTVYDTSGARFELKGGVGGSSLRAPASGALTPHAMPAPRPVATATRDPELEALSRADRAHVQFLERDLDLLRQNGARWQQANRASRAAARSIAPVSGASHVVGDPVTVRLPDIRTDFCQNFLSIAGRVAYVGTKSIIIEDNANSMAGTLDTTYAQIGSEFDNTMFPLLEANYGNPLAMDAALDNNGKIIMVFTDKMNPGSNPGHELGNLGLAGFVTSVDFQQPGTCPTSNVGEYFYATSPTASGTINTTGSPPRWRWSMRGTIIHEVKHIVSQAERASRNGTLGPYEVSWLEETTARLSEELYERARYSFAQKSNIGYGSAANPVGPYCGLRLACGQPRGIIRVFEELASPATFGGWYSNPQNYSPFGRFSSADFSFYSTGWSLVRWMMDASANSEASILKGMTQEPVKTGLANLEQYTGLTFATVQPKWLLSMLVDDYPGLALADASLTQPSWNFRDVFAGYKTDFGSAVLQNAWPLLPNVASFGAFSMVARARPGTAAVVQLSGPQSASQLLELKASGSSAAAPTELRVAIIRVQ